MEKFCKKLRYLFFISIFCTDVFSENAEIIVDISDQRLYLMVNNKAVDSFPVSTSKYGEGSIENSFKTPLGCLLYTSPSPRDS